MSEGVGPGVPRLSVRQAERAMARGEAVWVDIRTAAEVAGGHPPGAYHVPFMHARGAGRSLYNDAFVEEVAFLRQLLGRGRGAGPLLILGCHRGVRSQQAAELLGLCGVEGIADCPAGWSGVEDGLGRIVEPGWSRLGLPVARELEPGHAHGDLRAAMARAGR